MTMANNTAASKRQEEGPPVGGTPDTSKPTSSYEGRWQEYWHGQAQINGLLFETDKNIIMAVLELKKIVKGLAGSDVDFGPFLTAIYKAKDYAKQVPAVNPPGCIPPGGGTYDDPGNGWN
jgi:hypothetical protein